MLDEYEGDVSSSNLKHFFTETTFEIVFFFLSLTFLNKNISFDFNFVFILFKEYARHRVVVQTESNVDVLCEVYLWCGDLHRLDRSRQWTLNDTIEL